RARQRERDRRHLREGDDDLHHRRDALHRRRDGRAGGDGAQQLHQPAMTTAPSYEQIRNLLGRYTECMDLGDFDGLASLFTEAAMTDFEGREIGRGFEAIKANYVNGTQLYDGRPGTKHVTTNVQIEVDEEAGTASAKSAYVVFQATPNLPLQPIITGRYHDDF